MSTLSSGTKGDEYNPEPIHVNGTITAAGTPITITSPGGEDDPITLLLIRNPSKGPNSNSSSQHVLLINVDGTSSKFSLNRGESIYIPGNFVQCSIDATHNNVNFEAIIWY